MIQRYVALCDRDEACKTALAGQQVVVAVEDDWIADRVTDPKQPAFTVEEETHVDFGSKLVGLCLRARPDARAFLPRLPAPEGTHAPSWRASLRLPDESPETYARRAMRRAQDRCPWQDCGVTEPKEAPGGGG